MDSEKISSQDYDVNLNSITKLLSVVKIKNQNYKEKVSGKTIHNIIYKGKSVKNIKRQNSIQHMWKEPGKY